MKIKSKVDVITNSSTEVYTVISEKTEKELERILEKVTGERYIGNTNLPWSSYDLMSEEVKETWNEELYNPGVNQKSERVFQISLELDRQLGTRSWILRNLQTILSDTGLPVAWDPDEQRIREIWGYGRRIEWESLPPHNTLPDVKVCPPSTYSLILKGWIIWNGENPEKAVEKARKMFPGEEITLEMGFPIEEYPFNKLLMEIIK